MVTSTVWPDVKKKKDSTCILKMPFEKTIKILEILAYNHVYFSAWSLELRARNLRGTSFGSGVRLTNTRPRFNVYTLVDHE